MQCFHVIAIDNDATRLAFAKHNAEIYEVAHRIDFIHGDSIQLLPTLKADVVFLSPPWGGPGYVDAGDFDIGSIELGGLDGFELVELAKKAADSVAYFLPKTTTPSEVRKLGLRVGEPRIELESNYLNNKIKAKTAYFGPAFSKP